MFYNDRFRSVMQTKQEPVNS